MNSVGYTPIKIGNNIALYEFWRNHTDKDAFEITPEVIKSFEVCKHWRKKVNVEKNKIVLEPYFEDKDACKTVAEKKLIRND